ncbi:hypothetical protein M8O16_09595 [Enterobacter hormaechei]|nr:hypothetical protein [Enterobacter hormaechei]
MTLTKEWLLKTIAELEEERDATPGAVNEDADMALAAMKLALASLEAEPVAWISERNLKNLGKSYSVYVKHEPVMVRPIPLYTTPPALVSVPDERHDHLSELYHAQEKRLFKLAQRIKGASFDKYAYSPSQAIDVLESAIFGESDEEDSRAAMLQGAERGSNRDELTDAVNGLLAVMDEYPETLVPINRDSAVVRQLRVAAGD